MLRLILSLLGLLLIIDTEDGFADSLKMRQPNWRTQILSVYPNGAIEKTLFYEPSLQQDIDIPVKVVTFFESGEIQTETDLIVLEESDPIAQKARTRIVPHGASVVYWPHGLTAKVTFYEKGSLHGNLFRYNEKGTLIEKGVYLNGKLSGVLDRFYPDSVKASSAHYVDGVLEGEFTEWHPNGTLKSTRFYTRGLLNGNRQKPAVKVYDESRNLVEMADFRFGHPYGTNERGKQGFLPVAISEESDFKAIIVPPLEKEQLDVPPKDILEGEWKEYYPSKPDEKYPQLKKHLNYKQGRLHGEQKTFYPNGQLNTLLNYDEGVLHGEKVFWDNQGNVLERATYNHGDLEGEYYQLKQDGTEISSTYRRHRLHGVYQVCYPSLGQKEKVKAKEATYKDGLLDGELILYSKDGIKTASTFFRQGYREGLSTLYSTDGRVLMTAEYRQNKKNGLACEYHVNGNIKRQTPFVDDVENGEEKVFFEDGKLAGVHPFSNGVLHGTSKEWDKTGKLIFEAEYQQGKRHGHFRKYDQINNRWIDQIYKDDKLGS